MAAAILIDNRSAGIVPDAKVVHQVRSGNALVSTYVVGPAQRASRKDRLLSDPRKKAAIQRARQKIAAAIDDASEFSLSKLRLQAGLSQAQLAQRIGSQQPAIARLEKGAVDPGVSTITKIADALAVTPQAVLTALIATKNARQKA